MKVLIIYAHPSSESFNHALLESFLAGLRRAGHTYEVLDLYRHDFDPVIRNLNSRTEVTDDIKVYQKKIKMADCLAFVYPIFWYRAPAILEGFIDRVITAGFAFRYIKSIPRGLLSDKKAVVIETYGGPFWYYRFLFGNIPWRRFKAVLRFCGIRKITHYPCYGVPFTSDKVRQRYLSKVCQLGEGLK